MTRKAVARVLAVYFGIAAVLAAISTLATPGIVDIWWPASLGSFAGTALSFFLLPGLLPLIYWASRRFRAENAGGSIIVWGFFGVLFAFFAMAGAAYEGTMRLREIPTNIAGFFSNDHDTFVRVVRNSCIENQKTHPQLGITVEQATVFCNCYADALASQMRSAELTSSLARSPGGLPPTIQQKAVGAAPACRRAAFGH